MEFTWKIGATAGDGVFVTGRTMGKLFTRGGLNVVGYPEYPSLIRGGHNVYQIDVSDKQIYCPRKTVDIVVALNKDAVLFHKDKINKNGALIYDANIDLAGLDVRKDVKLYAIPFTKIITDLGAEPMMKNVIAMGATLGLVDYPFEMLKQVLTDEFSRKGDEIVKKNLDVAKAGLDFINATKHELVKDVKPISKNRKMFLAGNEAIALGAIKAGMKIYAAYPMTPASNVLHYLAVNERKADIFVKHTEDEISAVNYAIGAAYAGVRAMTGTSGGGFALMTETIGMSAIAETPLVVYLSQRGGPSTGLPTWTEQADLRFALHSSQGSFLRVVIAPGDVEESFYLTAECFNLAEKYQIPVILLSDKFLAESQFSADIDQTNVKIERGKIANGLPQLEAGKRFKRYMFTDNGISPRSFPGEPNGMHVASSYEHGETGETTEDFMTRSKMVEKRNDKKIKDLLKDIPLPKVYGAKDAEITLVTWGSHKLPVLDSLGLLEKEGIKANAIVFTYVCPLDQKKILALLSKSKVTVMIENNHNAQFAGVLKEETGWEPGFCILRYDGRPIFAEEIVEEIKKLKKAKFKGEKRIVIREEDYEYYSPDKYSKEQK
ncbi:MAG: 2-oxoacid:acceptor oxidoreductase subunit alpha [Candidatus Micrarchaeota archaeon]